MGGDGGMKTGWLVQWFEALGGLSVQDIWQLAALGDDALIAGGKAFDQGKVRLGRAHDGAEIDGRRRLRQRESAGTSTHALEVPRTRQDVDHLHQMPARDVVGLRRLFDRDKTVARGGGVHQHPQSVIREGRQPHSMIRCRRVPLPDGATAMMFGACREQAGDPANVALPQYNEL